MSSYIDGIRRDVQVSREVVRQANPRVVVETATEAGAERFRVWVDGGPVRAYKTRIGVDRLVARLGGRL